MEENTEIVTFDLPLEEIGRIALLAHEADMKLNDYIIKILTDYIGEKHEQK